jgi:hypothetical protein
MNGSDEGSGARNPPTMVKPVAPTGLDVAGGLDLGLKPQALCRRPCGADASLRTDQSSSDCMHCGSWLTITKESQSLRTDQGSSDVKKARPVVVER